MKLKIKVLEKGPMILTGSKVLKAIMDNYTPPVDLFAREVIQNSADAILEEKRFGKIKFTISTFNNLNLCDSIEGISPKMLEEYGDKDYKFISIADSNTCGLLGEAWKNENGGHNNLYNLVYDFMNEKDGDSSGGSWGIGKSVYYRYGNGICFYYSRTFENGVYNSKLAGALIQNEKNRNCLLGVNSSGIAYFGNIENNRSVPNCNEEDIKEFLSIFGLNPYKNEETGTVVIIPFLKEKELIEINNNIEDDEPREWLGNVESCLSMAIQRWYFPRINNEKFNGKYLKIAINNVMLQLCDFYDCLQKLYNGDLDESSELAINGKGFESNAVLGTLRYKLFDREELKIHVPPYNYSEPKYYVDSNIECDKEGLLFYTRKPGMILNYNNVDFGTYDIEEDKYLIGVFRLNDELVVDGENLGQYIRKTEKSNHYEWSNDVFADFPVLSKKKPYKKICATIKNHLNEVYKKSNAVAIEGSATILQKKYGSKLLPPLDFGDKPTIKGGGKHEPATPKKKKISISSLGITENDFLSYVVECILEKKEKIHFEINIKAGQKMYSFVAWENMDFKFPCKLKAIDIFELYIDGDRKPFPQILEVDENFTRGRKKLIDGDAVYKVKGLSTENNNACGFVLLNATNNQLKIKMRLDIEPIDTKYSIGFNTTIEKGE